MAPSSAPRRTSTTRTRSAPGPRKPARHLLAADEVVTSPQTRLRYRVERLLGRRAGSARPIWRGGSGGSPRRARRSSASRSASASTAGCARPTSGSCWTATRGPSASSTRSRSCAPDGRVLYCLALEYAQPRRPAGVPAPHGQGLAGDGRRGARSRASSRCWASCIAARCCTATSRR